MTSLHEEPSLAGRPRSVLLVEDDDDVAFGLQALLLGTGRYLIEHAPTAASARLALRATSFDVVVADLSLPDADGFHLLEEIATAYPATALLCLTGRNDASAAVRAMRAGAIDFLTKPTPAPRLLQALDTLSLRALPPTPGAHPVSEAPGAPRMPVGRSPAWRRTISLIETVARSPRTTVLLTGEPGVGKEEAATLLHLLSSRSAAPFITLNAACLAPSLVESELFGHEAGAFTGAARQRRGLFEQAQGGTLFLDEIGELPSDQQAKLLRVLEGHPFRRLGGERPVRVDVRLVCATNRNLEAQVAAGAFRADLLERLRVFEIQLPPLRERPGDIARLAHHFLTTLAPELGLRPRGISSEALAALEQHAFPGNVRELRNLIERALLLAHGGIIERRHLPPALAPLPLPPPSPPPTTSDHLDEVVRAHILRVYDRSGHNVTRCAAALGMSRLAVRKRLQSYGVRAPEEGSGRAKRSGSDR